MRENNPWNIKFDPEKIGSTMDAFGIADNTDVIPQRRVLLELIVQTVSERKFISENPINYEGRLKDQIINTQKLPSYKALEQAGDFSPEKISAVLDEAGLERLPVHAHAEQVMMVTGGPGTGKTFIVENLADEKLDVYRNAAQINPDHYKDLLENRQKMGAAHGTYTHYESSMLVDKIINNIESKMNANLPAPHVLMDVSTPYENYMEFSKQFDSMTVRTGTAPPEVTVQRAYDRGFDSDGKVVDRVTPTEKVLSGAAKSSELMPNIFEHPDLDFKMVNTNKLGNPIVAEWNNDTRILNIYDSDTFFDFTERKNINFLAKNADELFEGVERTPETMARDLQPYTDKGIQIDLLNEDKAVAISLSQDKVEVYDALPSKREVGFMDDMAESFRKFGGRAGGLGGVVIAPLAGAVTLMATGDTAQAVEVTFETGVPYGETALDVVDGDMGAAAHSATIETVATVAGGAVAIGGAIIGAPALVIVGGTIAVGYAASEATEFVLDHGDEIIDSTMTAIDDVGATISKAASTSLDYVAEQAKEAWDGITSIFSDETAPKIETTLNSDEVRNSLQNLSEDQVAVMSPEVQSLYQYREHPELFKKQFKELEEDGGLSEIKNEMEIIPKEAITPMHSKVSSTENSESYRYLNTGLATPAM